MELVTDYLEDALPDEQRARFEHHLASCSGCTAYVDHIQQTISLAGRVTEQDLGTEAADALLEAFRGWRRAGGAELRG